MTEVRYKAFISYSHEDEYWARWLQRALERYRVPKSLAGEKGSFGRIPASLTPVFRDRVDLSSGADLTKSLRHELAASETLVVICSPAAARSRWVNEEIMAFKALGRADRIYALIVDGDPQATDRAERCFPEALIENEYGTELEPLAADVRKWADGKVLAKLKLVAGILGARLDEVRQREMHRRRRNGILSGVTIAAIVLLTTILSVTAISNRKMAEQRRANTEELVGFMLGTVEDLSPVSGLDVLDEDQHEMVRLAEQLEFHTLADAALLRKALRWREDGMSARDRGDGQSAMTAFSSSLAALVHLYQRDTQNNDHLFEVGQAEFWVGYVHMDNGDYDQAEDSMARYGVVARRLINSNPKSAENVIELSYTLGNLAAIETMRSERDDDKAIRLLQAATEYNQLAIVLEPNNQYYRSNMANSLAWLADGWLGICDLDRANQYRLENVAVLKQLVEQEPGDSELLEALAHGLSGISVVQNTMGLTDRAVDNMRLSVSLLADLARVHAEIESYEWDRVRRLEFIGEILIYTGRTVEAQELILESARRVAEVQGQADDLPLWKMKYLVGSLMSRSLLAEEQGREEDARNFNLEAIRMLSEMVLESPDSASANNGLAGALFRYWQLNDAFPPLELQALAKDYSLSEPPVKSCGRANLAARQAVMHERLDLAKYYTDYLLDRGYKPPSFVRFCQDYGLCNSDE